MPSTTLENDRPTGIEHGSVLYTHGHKLDQPLDVIRMGHWSAAQQWGGPYPVHPIADWRGSFINGTDWEGRALPCGTGGCTIIWPQYSAFYVRQPATQTTFFGSLIWGKEDGSGLQYMRNRYYNPQTGAFTQQDPIGLAGGLNTYGFAAGDPVSYSDPYGLSPVPADDPYPLNFGGGYRGRVDMFTESGEVKHEIHVVRVNASGKATEVGVFGRDGWLARHGFDGSDPGLPRAVLNKVNGQNVLELRRLGVVGRRGTQNIVGGGYSARVQGLFRGLGAVGFIADIGGALNADREARRLGISPWTYMSLRMTGATPEGIAQNYSRIH